MMPETQNTISLYSFKRLAVGSFLLVIIALSVFYIFMNFVPIVFDKKAEITTEVAAQPITTEEQVETVSALATASLSAISEKERFNSLDYLMVNGTVKKNSQPAIESAPTQSERDIILNSLGK